MRELVVEHGVALIPSNVDAEASYQGPGTDAGRAWEAFAAVAVEPAFDPVRMWGDLQPVSDAGFLFEAVATRGRPERYALLFTRQFRVGDAGDMVGLKFSIRFPAADQLHALHAEIWSEAATDAQPFPVAASNWVAEVEAHSAFSVPMTRHHALQFSFGIDGIG